MNTVSFFLTRASAAALVVMLGAAPLLAQGQAEEIRVTLGKSLVIDYPEDVSRISTSNPDIVDYVPVSSREILLHAKGLGVATVVIWAKSGQRNFYNMTVEMNLDPVRKLIRESFANEDVTVSSSRDAITVSGRVSSQAVGDRLVALLAPFSKAVVNNTRIATAPSDKQILLRVKFAELNRNSTFQFGMNILSTGAANTPGYISTGQFQSANPSGSISGSIGRGLAGSTSQFNISDALNIFAFRPDLNLAAFVKLLQNEGMLQILAEPNLVTSNGKEASFLVGGEFPVPVLQGGSNAGAVTIQFREFGIRLSFNPTITENKTLKMYVKPEVSTIDMANAVSFNGFTIPALATRRVESNIELAVGQSFVIGGLIDDRVNETYNKIPGLANIPLLGQLFKSRNENRNKTELIVMVTPEMVEPTAAGDPQLTPQMPGQFLRPMMLPNGMPQNTNAGSGASGTKGGTPVTSKKDAWKKVTPQAGK